MEAAALARVKHPRVVRFLDFGFDPRWPYLVTEFFEGRPLGELLRDGGGAAAGVGVYLISQMVDALGAVWQAGLVHRDIKPDNILVGPDGDGEADRLRAGEGRGAPGEPARPAGPELAGTAAYLAPEQAKDASVVDHRADIYSLGVTLYEALTGRLPFEGRNRVQVIFQHLNTPPVPPAERDAGRSRRWRPTCACGCWRRTPTTARRTTRNCARRSTPSWASERRRPSCH